MDSLEEFEKSLAAEKVEREASERRHRKHRHRHDAHEDRDRDRHRHRHRDRDRDGDKDKHKERHRDADEEHRHKRSRRDAWMTDPSAIEVEHVRRPSRRSPRASPEPPKRPIHSRELNAAYLSGAADPPAPAPSRTVDYTFGDAGSTWRMTKLRAVYDSAEQSGRPVEDVAVQQFGSLELFDDAREESEEMERRRLYGPGYQAAKERPTGELFRERRQTLDNAAEVDPEPEPQQQQQQQPVDQTTLNRLRAAMMKAKLRRAPNAAQLEEEFNRAAALSASSSSAAGISAPEAVVLGAKESRLLAGTRGEVQPVDTKRGRARKLVEENADMTLDDMVREERRTKGQPGGEARLQAERIARDGTFTTDLEYLDDNAARLARRVHRTDASLKSAAVHDFQRLERVLDRCALCPREDAGLPPLAPVVSLGTRVFLTLPPAPEVSPGGAAVVPLAHRANLLECDDDEWEELRNFMKSLTRMYHDQGRDVLFYENAAAPRRRGQHAALLAVPIPYDQGATAPAFFREAMLAAAHEWATHQKVIDTGAKARAGLGRAAFRRSLAKESPYFHVWFELDGGLGHVVEDEDRWPRGDLFAREVVGGIVGAEPHLVKKHARWGGPDDRVEPFKKAWRKFDWTRVLTDS